MKKWTIEEVATGLYGKTPAPVGRMIMVLADGWDGAANVGVDPESGEIYAMQRIAISHEGGFASYWYKGFATDYHYCGIPVPAENQEDCDMVETAQAEYRKFRRRIEDALRKTTHPRAMAKIAQIVGVYL